MAEKYGTKPKKFTSEWWEYFWMYYRWHVIVIAFIVIAIAVTIYQNATAPKYDLTLTYAASSAFSDELSDEIVSSLSPLCEDVDGNGEKSLNFMQLNINDELDMEYSIAMRSKLNLTISEDDVYIYIFDAETVAPYIGETKDDSSLVPLENWYEGDTSEKSTYSVDGTSYGIELTECEAFKEISQKTGADFSGNYLFIRYYPRKDQLKKQLDGYNAAIELAKKIVKR